MIESVLANKEAVTEVLIWVNRLLALSAEELVRKKDVIVSMVAPTIRKLLDKELQVKEFDSALVVQIKTTTKADLSKRD